MLIPILVASVTLGALQMPGVGTPSDSVERARAIHALNRLTFGPRPGDVDRVLTLGVDQFISQQLAPPTDMLLEKRVAQFSVSQQSNADLGQLYFDLLRERRARQQQEGDSVPIPANGPAAIAFRRHMDEFQQITMLRAARSEQQLYEVLVGFWTNHFNVFAQKGAVRFLVRDHVERIIRPNVFGKFEDLLLATAQSPAMLVYLDNVNSVTPGSIPPQIATRRDRLQRAERTGSRGGNGGRNSDRLQSARSQMERVMARLPSGLNENYARELLELHTVGVDGGYTQEDVVNTAWIMTGWSADVAGRPGSTADFQFNAWAHDLGDKVVMGQSYPADGVNEGRALLKVLANHPSTQRHITTRLCEKFVSDMPSEGCIQSGTAAWRTTGGDLREVVRAIINSPDFWALSNRNTKTKTPMEFLVSGVRALNAYPDTTRMMVQMVRRLGQPLYGQEAPTGYPETQADWVNAGALLNRLNIGLAIASGRGRVLGIDLDEIAPLSLSLSETIDAINASVLNGQATPNTLRVMAERATAIANPRQRRAFLFSLALGSPEFQRQ